MMRSWVTWLIAMLVMLPVQAQELRFGAAYWCPYSCPNKDMPGFLVEYFTWLMAKRNIQLHVEVIPFSRALTATEHGELDGVLTVMLREAPQLPVTSVPTMTHRNCFFTKPSSTWQFTGVDQLGTTRIGVVNNYAYGEEIDQYIADHGLPLIFKMRDRLPEERLFSMLDSDRIDTYLSDFYVQRWQQKHLRQDQPPHRLATCLEAAELYVGFSPKLENYAELAAWVSQEVQKTENIQRRLEFEQRYQ